MMIIITTILMKVIIIIATILIITIMVKMTMIVITITESRDLILLQKSTQNLLKILQYDKAIGCPLGRWVDGLRGHIINPFTWEIKSTVPWAIGNPHINFHSVLSVMFSAESPYSHAKLPRNKIK